MPSVSKTLAAFLAVTSVNARWLKGSRDEESWAPPKETVTSTDTIGFSPKPTSAPDNNIADLQLLAKRDTASVCMFYMSSNTLGSLDCGSGYACYSNTIYSVMGCCSTAGSSCYVPTVCYDYTQSAAFSASSNSRAWYCGNSARPYCESLGFDSLDSYYPGYSVYDYCWSTRVTQTNGFYSAADAITGDPSSTTTKTSTTSSTTTSSSSSSSSTSASATPAPVDNSSGPPVGPIVGGVVGGVAVLALIGLGIFFIMRSNKKRQNAAAAPAPGPNPAGPPGPQYNPNFNPNGGAVAAAYPSGVPTESHLEAPKSQYGSSISPVSPNPSEAASFQPMAGVHQPQYPQQYQQQYAAPQQYPQHTGTSGFSQATPPPAGQYPPQQHPQQPPQHASELSTEKGDKQLQELA